MEYWDKEEIPNDHNGISATKISDHDAQLQSEKTHVAPSSLGNGTNNYCSISVNGHLVAEVDVSNVDEVQKIVSTLSKKRKNSKDFLAV